MRRTTERIRMGNLRGRQDLLVDVDMANIVDGARGCSCTSETSTSPLGRWCFACNRRTSVQAIWRSPSTCLQAKQNPCSVLRSRFGEGDEDVIGSLVRLLQLGTTSWQSLLPNRYGEATVTVRLENEDGDLLLGQQINTRVRSGTKKRLRRTGVVVSATLSSVWWLRSSSKSIDCCLCEPKPLTGALKWSTARHRHAPGPRRARRASRC
ncbi:MAG: hypothetical protein CM15mP128_3880 [Methanobacteriota archaeon]|nr:MAG: hypothetical protein CM15mP128_3880 [Euryarchaeota archaeon]